MGMDTTISLAKKHLEHLPENIGVLRADLIKVITKYEVLEKKLRKEHTHNFKPIGSTKRVLLMKCSCGASFNHNL